LKNGQQVKHFPQIEKTFFINLITGKCDLKLLVWKKIKEMPVVEGEEEVYLKFKKYAEVMTDFMGKEIVKLMDKESPEEMFRNIDLFRDEFDRLN